MKRKFYNKELITYIIAGGITTAVNYIIYGSLLFLNIPYIAANSIAWAGAVITTYALNRKWVFRSRNQLAKEFFAFASLRFITLLVENLLLWIAIDELNVSPLAAKIIVSVVTVIGNYALCKHRVFKTFD